MKWALIFIALLILFSATVSALPFKIVVGKDGVRHLDAWSVNPFDFNFYFPNKVFFDFAYVSAVKEYYRCGGHWFIEVLDSGVVLERSANQDICKRNGGCARTVNLFLSEGDLASVRSADVRSECSSGYCHPSIYGDLIFIEGKDIHSAITSKSGIVGFGSIESILGNFIFTEAIANDFVVKSDNPRVLVWVGNRDPGTPLVVRTSDKGKNIWACYDGDLNGRCDYNENPACLADYGDMYTGVCCGVNISECRFVGLYDGKKIDAFCTRLENGESAWIARENVGEIFDLDSSYCPAKNIVSDGNKFFSGSKVFDYLILESRGNILPAACPAGYAEMEFYSEPFTRVFTAVDRSHYRVCGKDSLLGGDSVFVSARYGYHEYISSAGNLFECAADFPFSTNNNASLGQNTRNLSGTVCPEGMILYYPLEGSADNFVSTFVNGVPNSVSFTAGKIGNAALFSAPESDIEIANDTINLNLPEFSFEAWIKPYDVSGKHIIFNSELSVELYINDGKLKASFYTDDFPSGVYLTSSGALSVNNWYHVVLSYDSQKARIYSNGAIVASEDLTGHINAGSTSFIIGARSFDPNEPFNGLIDEVAVYSSAMDSAVIQSHAHSAGEYCFVSVMNETYYCASDGDWTMDLDVKDSKSCRAAGFEWTGHKCCSEFDDSSESYSDYSSPATLISSLILEQNKVNVSYHDAFLDDEDSFITVKGPARFLAARSYWRSERGDIVPCLDKEDILTSFDLGEGQSKRIKNQFFPHEPYCRIGRTRVTSLPILASGGCFDKVFYPSGSLLHQSIINYQGGFVACKNIPSAYQSYAFINLTPNHCGNPFVNITMDLHAVCLPDGVWGFTNDPRTTVVDDTLWDPVVLNVSNAYKFGCCPVDLCWNGTGCQPVNTFYRINEQGFVCR